MATSRFVFPSATRTATRCQGSWRRCPAADTPKLGARSLGPERGSQSVEYSEGVLERPASITAALRSTLGHTEGQERSATIERDVDTLMPDERVGIGCDRGVERPILRSEQPAATRACRNRRRALEPPRVFLVPVEKLDRLVAPPQLEQRLDLIAH